jgi:hypothetical protein
MLIALLFGQANLKVDLDMVLVNVTVTDARGKFVQGLTRETFQIWEDKVEQQITTFEREDTPISVGYVIDRSGSMGAGGKNPGIIIAGTGKDGKKLDSPAERSALSSLAQTRLEKCDRLLTAVLGPA